MVTLSLSIKMHSEHLVCPGPGCITTVSVPYDVIGVQGSIEFLKRLNRSRDAEFLESMLARRA